MTMIPETACLAPGAWDGQHTVSWLPNSESPVENGAKTNPMIFGFSRVFNHPFGGGISLAHRFSLGISHDALDSMDLPR